MRADVPPPALVGRDRWLIYALGGGLGHLTRAVALARAASDGRRSLRVLTNSPFAACLSVERVLGERASLVRIDPALGRDGVAAIVEASLERCDFDVLIVDTFPRGLGGELAPRLDRLPCPKVLIHRDIDPAYVEWAGLRSFGSRFDLILLPGEDAPLADLPHAKRTAPWLLRDRDELVDRAEARGRLLLPRDDRPSVVVSGCGRAEELRAAHALAARLQGHLAHTATVRFASVVGGQEPGGPPGLTIWPLLDVMAGIDVLVGSGGYNTVHEARATGTPLVALARPRRYDRQSRRLCPDERAVDESDVLRRVSERIAERSGGAGTLPMYENGVHAAVSLIDRLVTGGRTSSLSDSRP